ncbi:carbon storage regulator [Crassaminicella indica]|uniref:Translational regulator CsrA n=1 Tax=Crassaminicella indica TaxID=2855394 RepID=A0ABX8RBS8_9CLOT|nr:carbon storage regulator [Crassaminicella indica]QXM05170.1 carbon storage regulator [Crassaminicella indica]
MLVIGRKPGEYVVIGENIKVKVVKSNDGDLRLAIDAPKDIKIVRGEIYEQEHLQEAK